MGRSFNGHAALTKITSFIPFSLRGVVYRYSVIATEPRDRGNLLINSFNANRLP